jgi:predicted ATP-grasp superfamily ATP-dependent carboligase
MLPKYEEDFYGWAINTAQLLKDGKMHELDFENIIEEIEALGRSEKSQLRNPVASS